ncbi:uncharacterized protein GGS22DRAFT_191392 [Annulohypoxylon maeteangense]|uniref:uncharacterized protein n=1 Tax=Annulohypoxylon maeteangense TaxID=1927788 RepID=UPI002007273C|nr:uncharacterized protein GGS22DRAFT_191392 [Annulohypoxylon maeteangense]KAI0882222.1 hypothetical protein GGS22DRAFT_191392 [Annulohypoxylon maeteangense]
MSKAEYSRVPLQNQKSRSDPDDALPAYRPKKSKSRRSRDNLPSYEEAAEPSWSPVVHPPCAHLSESGCVMIAKSNLCCSCMDERPVPDSGLYPMYVDGEGWVERAKKWQFYCPNCQEYFDPDAKRRMMRDQCMWAEARAQSLADERDKKYFGLGRWIHHCSEAVKKCFPE